MNITSLAFFSVLLLEILVYYILPTRYKWLAFLCGNIYVIVSTVYIGVLWVPFLMLGVAYITALLIDNKRDEVSVVGILKVALGILVIMLVSFREQRLYYNVLNGISSLIGKSVTILDSPTGPLLGISYFSLILISYVCNVYWGMIKPEKNVIKLFTVCMFFPIMTSGPIVKYEEVSGKIFEGKQLSYRNLCFGLQRMIWGYFKKLVISERLKVIVDEIYANYSNYDGVCVLIAVFAFALQLYMDFSGCIDIMLGMAQLFGIELPENFNYPFASKNLSEFWRRWHITLGGWLREYIFYPLQRSEDWAKFGGACRNKFGKKWGKKISVWCALMITWSIIGAWHGFGLNYVFGVGIYMCLVIIAGELLDPLFSDAKKKLHINVESRIWKAFKRIRTFVLFSIGLSFFRAESFVDGIEMWNFCLREFNTKAVTGGVLLKMGLSFSNIVVAIIAIGFIAVCGCISMHKQLMLREIIEKQNIVIRWFLYVTLICVVLVFGIYGPEYNVSDFIYGGF